jgi:hypothetical protein
VSVVWERLAGDTSEFAVKLAFLRDPDAGEAASPEERLSWGAFQLWVRGCNLCLHTEEGEVLDSVHWYLLPLLEWLAASWEALLHEEKLPARNAGDSAWESLLATRFPPEAAEGERARSWEQEWHSWWTRHAIHACRSGGLFPDVVLRRWRDRIEVSWGGHRDGGAPPHFRFLVPRGAERLAPQAVAGPLHEVLRDSARFLATRSRESSRLRALERAVEAATSPRQRERLELQAGLDEAWGDVLAVLQAQPAEVQEAVLGVGQTGVAVEEPCHAVLMFGSVSPNLGREDARTLTGKLIDLYSPSGEGEGLRRLVSALPATANEDPPWEQGQRLAEWTLGELRLLEGDRDRIAVEDALSTLGVRIGTVELRDHGIRAVAVAGPRHRASVLSNVSHPTYVYPSGRRFTLAHELCHLIADRAYGMRLALASGPWAPRDIEKRANAFAAMFLMPPALVARIARRLPVPVSEKGSVKELARALGASFTATVEHLCNLGFIDEGDRERLRTEADSRE